jgi:hypothetical protein
MRYLLGTNTWIEYLKRPGSLVEARLRQTRAEDVALCSVVWVELLHGARKYEKRDERVARIERTLAPFRSLPFDDAAAHRYAEIRGELPTDVTAKWSALGLTGSQRVRDLWRQKDLGEFPTEFSAKLRRHGCAMLRVWPRQ